MLYFINNYLFCDNDKKGKMNSLAHAHIITWYYNNFIVYNNYDIKLHKLLDHKQLVYTLDHKNKNKDSHTIINIKLNKM